MYMVDFRIHHRKKQKKCAKDAGAFFFVGVEVGGRGSDALLQAI